MHESHPVSITVAGENALMVRFGNESGSAVSARIQAAATLLSDTLGAELLDLVPGFTTLLVVLEPRRVDLLALRRRIGILLRQLDSTAAPPGKLLELPVYYSPESGPDLDRV
ncbi:MAG TPA: carboxyltransferase domain-containing protein, partial [Porticoccaceae bacterium]